MSLNENYGTIKLFIHRYLCDIFTIIFFNLGECLIYLNNVLKSYLIHFFLLLNIYDNY